MTREFTFRKIDAFATTNSSGNPAGYIPLADMSELDESSMLQIAKELKGFVNEVGYVAQIGESEFDLRYFSSEREVDFCGHATVAIFYDIIKTNPSFWNVDKIKINTKRGSLVVLNEVDKRDAVFILSPEPVFRDELIPPIDEIAKHLQTAPSSISAELPISVINAGLNTLILPVSGLDTILGIQPDLLTLKKFCEKHQVDIVIVFTAETTSRASEYRTRVFAPTFGYLEDPATGSGNSALGYYLLNLQKWKSENIQIEQNNSRDQFNVIKLRLDEVANTKRVYFGGAAMTRIVGHYLLHK